MHVLINVPTTVSGNVNFDMGDFPKQIEEI